MRTGARRKAILAAFAGLAMLTSGAGALGETPEELDALADASAAEESGIALAQQQAGRGELLEAIATLERVLAAEPKSVSARLLQVLYLCDSDDRTGAWVALGKIKRKAITEEARQTLMRKCNFGGDAT